MNRCKDCKVDNGLIMTQCYSCQREKETPKKRAEQPVDKEKKVDCLAHLPII